MEKTPGILPAVAAIIFNEQGQVLLQKRKDVNEWCIISGHVEFGETVEAAIIREIREETGTAASVKRCIGIYSSPDSQTYHYTSGSVQYITTYFEAILHDEIAADFCNEETAALGFFDPAALPGNFARINSYWLSDALDISGQFFVR